MARAFANRMLFGLVVSVVVSLPFVFHWWGLGGSDDGAQGSAGSLVAAALVDPYVTSANDEAAAEGRTTTLADVRAALPAPGSSGAATADPAAAGLSSTPVFTVTADRVVATVSALGAPVTCVITISGGKAVDHCGS